MEKVIISKYTGLLDNVIADYSLFDDGTVLFESYWKGSEGVDRVSTATYTKNDLAGMGYENGIDFIQSKSKKYTKFKDTTRLSCYPLNVNCKVSTTSFAENNLNLSVTGTIDRMKKAYGRKLARVVNGDKTRWVDTRYLRYAL